MGMITIYILIDIYKIEQKRWAATTSSFLQLVFRICLTIVNSIFILPAPTAGWGFHMMWWSSFLRNESSVLLELDCYSLLLIFTTVRGKLVCDSASLEFETFSSLFPLCSNNQISLWYQGLIIPDNSVTSFFSYCSNVN